MNCIICLDSENRLTKYTSCACNIYFHKECWIEFRRYSNRCPNCRSIIIDQKPIILCPIFVLFINFVIFILYNVLFFKSDDWNEDYYFLFYIFSMFFLTTEIIFSHIDYVEQKINFLSKHIMMSRNKVGIWMLIMYHLLWALYSFTIFIIMMFNLDIDVYLFSSNIVFICSACQRFCFLQK